MIITCPKCKTSFAIDEERTGPVKPGKKVRCSRCRNIFAVSLTSSPSYPQQEPKTSPNRESIAEKALQPPPQQADNRQKMPAPEPEEDEYGPEETIAIGTLIDDMERDAEYRAEETIALGALTGLQSRSSDRAEIPEAIAGEGSRRKAPTRHPMPPLPVSSTPAAEVPADEPGSKNRYTPFKRKLIYFALFIIIFIAAIVIPIEAVRPWKELDQLIERAQNLIAGTKAAIQPQDMDRMNLFALETIQRPIPDVDQYRPYYFLSFNMLLMEGKILPKEEIEARLLYPDEFEGGLDYDRLQMAAEYWAGRFSRSPGVLDIFQKNKWILIRAKENAEAAGFSLSAIYIMLDAGQKKGFFTDKIAYVLDSVPWWSDTIPSSSGEPYLISGNEFWRADAIAGRTAFGNNPIFDPDKWYPMPLFDEDEWGSWFSVWLTTETEGLYNIFNIDFNARRVKQLMLLVAASVTGTILILLILVILIANALSRRVTRPITELTRGAAEVSMGNFDYSVPVLKEDEFGELTRHFNQMTNIQRERFNLMETLKKFLSEDLAEKAAESGIVIGGQKANCTVMFTDFAGFSTITRKMSASESVNALNAYFDALIPVIKRYGGFPDKYIGDAIVALFGAPVTIEDHAERAVMCAIEMQQAMRTLNDERRRSGKTIFEMRIGLNSGEVIVGAIGCDMKLEYTSIGETTNLANRMESICEIGHVMIAEGTYFQIKDVFFAGVHIEETPQKVSVKGYPRPVDTYRIYVNNLDIAKDMEKERYEFYVYKEVDHDLKNSPDEVKGRTFSKKATVL